jgi:uncharacterized protein YhdP
VIDTKVNGQLQFMNNEVSLQPGIPVVSGLNGKLEFTETGVSLGCCADKRWVVRWRSVAAV